ncbi:glycosyltransferase [Thalassotalea nanhaiensis]|uniref:Glycosyltransferase n=1 Tax=Thalassotalea nanhaiensis TaxID=3065648 RepID=A0ABY9TL57_9GAMM|nr:glycosyltransferase [Colwelliaceae bacterium SQ345]
MKILILLSRLNRGGAEIRTLSLLKELSSNKKFKIYVYLTSGERCELDNEYEKYSELIYRNKSYPIAFDFMSTIRNIKFDVVHINANLASGVYCFLSYLLGIKKRISHIRTSSDYGSGVLYNLKKKVYSFLTNTFSTRIIGVCDGARDLCNSPSSKWITIYNGIETKGRKFEFEPQIQLPSDAIKLIMIGRLADIKNHSFAIDIVSKFKGKVILDIYGEGAADYVESINKNIIAKNLVGIVNLKGNCKAPLVVIPKYDLLILPSKREGLPGVVLEALSCGVPVVCTNLPGCSEISKYSTAVNCLPIEKDNVNDWISNIQNFKNNSSEDLIISEFNSSPFLHHIHCEGITNVWKQK